MKTIFKGDLLILVPESRDEATALAHWRAGRDGHQLVLLPPRGPAAAMRFIHPSLEPSTGLADAEAEQAVELARDAEPTRELPRLDDGV